MDAAPALAELGQVPWRAPTDQRFLRRYGRIWLAWTVAYTVPFLAAGVVLMAVQPLAFPVVAASFAHAWIIPELYAFRGASVLRPKGPRNERSEPVAQGLLGDLLGHDARELQRRTGLALERSAWGVWLIGEAGAILLPPGGRRAHCFCVRVHRPRASALGPDRPPAAGAANRRAGLRHGGQPRLLRRPLARPAPAAGTHAPGPGRGPGGRPCPPRAGDRRPATGDRTYGVACRPCLTS